MAGGAQKGVMGEAVKKEDEEDEEEEDGRLSPSPSSSFSSMIQRLKTFVLRLCCIHGGQRSSE